MSSCIRRVVNRADGAQLSADSPEGSHWRPCLGPFQGMLFRWRLTTTRKSLRAAPPRSELIETLQLRFDGKGDDSTVEMWGMTPALPAI